MELSKIHHVAIIVSDYEAAREFYVEKLGFRVKRENYRPERGDWKLDLRLSDTVELEIFAEKNPPARGLRAAASGVLGGKRGGNRARACPKGHCVRAHPHRHLYRRKNDLFP